MSDLLPTATSAEEAERAATIAVLPVGSFEQHGDHLPLATDTMIACILAREIADTYGLLLLPPITISCSHEHHGWAGTVSISARTLHAVITDVADSLAKSGIHRLLLVNCHGGNYVLSNVVQEASVDGPRMALFPAGAQWNRARELAGLDITDGHSDMHAGELETSILLYAWPEVVRDTWQRANHETTDRAALAHTRDARLHHDRCHRTSLAGQCREGKGRGASTRPDRRRSRRRTHSRDGRRVAPPPARRPGRRRGGQSRAVPPRGTGGSASLPVGARRVVVGSGDHARPRPSGSDAGPRDGRGPA